MAFWDIFRRKNKDEFGLAGLSESSFPKKDELGLPHPGSDLGLPESKYQEPMFGSPTPPQAFKELSQSTGPSVSSKDIELLSAKLDTIKAMLDNISNRIAVVEKQISEEKTKHEQTKRIGWYA